MILINDLNTDKVSTGSIELDKIEKEVLNLNCELANERRTNNLFYVFGEGDIGSKIMLIGEAPGKQESLTGKPFCGASGKFLDILLNSINLSRPTVYITNLVKDRPPENRDPLPEEIDIYGKILIKQIKIIKPKLIITLGRYSMKYIFNYAGISEQLLPISKIHGKIFNTKLSYGNVHIITMYHPASALYNGSNRQVLINDFQNVKSLIV